MNSTFGLTSTNKITLFKITYQIFTSNLAPIYLSTLTKIGHKILHSLQLNKRAEAIMPPFLQRILKTNMLQKLP